MEGAMIMFNRFGRCVGGMGVRWGCCVCVCVCVWGGGGGGGVMDIFQSHVLGYFDIIQNSFKKFERVAVPQLKLIILMECLVVQSGAIITRSNISWYHIHNYNTRAEDKSVFQITENTQYINISPSIVRNLEKTDRVTAAPHFNMV